MRVDENIRTCASLAKEGRHSLMLRRGRARSTEAATLHIPVDDLLRMEKVQAFQDLPPG